MAKPRLIVPCADSSCGKVFFANRRTADGHRVALEFWDRATGQVREGSQLVVYRCRRCGGFHIRYKRVEHPRIQLVSRGLCTALNVGAQTGLDWPTSRLDPTRD
jgi:hypothetical protein